MVSLCLISKKDTIGDYVKVLNYLYMKTIKPFFLANNLSAAIIDSEIQYFIDENA
jgi:hypothetical protein